jgi:hypothetical protein
MYISMVDNATHVRNHLPVLFYIVIYVTTICARIASTGATGVTGATGAVGVTGAVGATGATGGVKLTQHDEDVILKCVNGWSPRRRREEGERSLTTFPLKIDFSI